MANLICTVIVDGPETNYSLFDVCVRSQLEWSRRIKANYMEIHVDDKKFRINKQMRHISYSRFTVYDMIMQWDGLLCLDPDMLVKPNAPDVFNEFPDRDVHYSIRRNETSSGGAGSIMLFAKRPEYYDLSVLDDMKEVPKTDEKVQAVLFSITKPRIQNMGFKWNNFYTTNGWEVPREESYIIHYKGHHILDACGLSLSEFKARSAEEDYISFCK